MDQSPKKSAVLYGMRGAVIHAIVRTLRNGPLKADQAFQAEGWEERGYCNPRRLLLNVLLNLGWRSLRSVTLGADIDEGHCTLFRVLQTLSPPFSSEEVIWAIEKAFLHHRDNWVHLVSIYGHPVTEVGDLDELRTRYDSYQDLVARQRACHPANILQPPEEVIGEARTLVAPLKDVTLRITPAGIAYLKHIMPHFEFYSLRHGRDAPPLFECLPSLPDVRPLSNKDWLERVDSIISPVIRDYRKHVEWMSLFLEKRISDQFGWDRDDYLSSRLSFKFIGAEMRTHGVFHADRVFDFHLHYLDRFRRKVLAGAHWEEDEKRVTNERLVSYISEYLKIISGSMVARPGSVKYQVCRNKIDEIEENGFRDFTSPIEYRQPLTEV